MITDVSLTRATFWKSIEEFLIAFSTPAIADDGIHVIYGSADDQSLPPDNEFIVYTPISQSRRGRTFQEWHKTDDVIGWREYVEVILQIDCYSSSPVHAMSRAQTFETMARSEAGVDFLKARHIDCLYADSVRNLTNLLDSGKPVPRWSLELHVGYWKQLQTDQDYFTSADVDVINVDVRFPPS